MIFTKLFGMVFTGYISDDIVIIEKIRGSLIGKSPDSIKELIEIRGIGIINVREIFGSNAIENESKIDPKT